MRKLFFIFSFLILKAVHSQNLIPYACDEKWGYADNSGNIVIPCQYDEAFPFYEGRALIVKYNYDDKGFSDKTESFIDSSGRVVFNLESNMMMEQTATRFSNGISLIQNYKNNSDDNASYISLVDKNGKEINRVRNAVLTSGYGEFSNYQTTFNQFGFYIANCYIDDVSSTFFIYKDAKTVKSIKGFNLYEFRNGAFTIAESNDGVALIDTAGNIVIKPSKYRLISYGDSLVSFIGKNEKIGFVDLKGKIAIKANFESALPFSEGMAVFGTKVKSEDDKFKFGYINKKGKVVLPPVYDEANDFSEGLAEVRIADSLFFIDQIGNKILRFYSKKNESEFLFDYRSGFNNGKAFVIINGNMGLIDRNGNFLIQPMYKGLQLGSPINTIFKFDQGITKISHPGFFYCYIDESGFPYVQSSFSILPKKDQCSIYSKPNLDSILEEKGDFWLKKVKKFIGLTLEKDGVNSEWIEVSDYKQIQYVLSKDFYTNCNKVINKKGAKIYKTEVDEIPCKFFAYGTMVFPDLNQKTSQNNRIAIRTVSTAFESDGDYSPKLFYIDANDLQKMEKPKL